MAARGAAQVLRERIGHEATDALITMMNESNRLLGEELLRATADRFERRLTEEVSALRFETHKGFSELRTEMRVGFAKVDADLAVARIDVLRWSFLFWVGQLGALAGLLAYMK